MTGHQIIDCRSIDSEVSSLSYHDSSLNEIDRCTSKIDSSLNLYNLSKIEKCLLYLYNTLDIEDDDHCCKYNNDQESTVSSASILANYAESENDVDNEYGVKNFIDTEKLLPENDMKRESLPRVKIEKPVSHSYTAERRKYKKTIRKRNKNCLQRETSHDKIAEKLNSWAIGNSRRVKFHPFLRIFDKHGVAVTRSVKDHDIRGRPYSNTPKFNSFLLKAALKYRDPKLLANAAVFVKKGILQTGLRADAEGSETNKISIPEQFREIHAGNDSDSNTQNLGGLNFKDCENCKKSSLPIDRSTKALDSKIYLSEIKGQFLNRLKFSTSRIFPCEGQEILGTFQNTKSELENITVRRTAASSEKANVVKQEVVFITDQTNPRTKWKLAEEKINQIQLTPADTEEITSQVWSQRGSSLDFQIDDNQWPIHDVNNVMKKNTENPLVFGTTGKFQGEPISDETIKVDSTWQEEKDTVENEIKIYRASLGRSKYSDDEPFIKLPTDLSAREQWKDCTNGNTSGLVTGVIHDFDSESNEFRSEVNKIKVEYNKPDEVSERLFSGNKNIERNVQPGAIIIAPTLNFNFGKSAVSSVSVDQSKNFTNCTQPPRNVQQFFRNDENSGRNSALNNVSVAGASYSTVNLPTPYLNNHRQQLLLPKPMPIDLSRRYLDRSALGDVDPWNESPILRSRCSTELERAKIEVYKRIFETMLIDPDFDFVQAEDQLENISAGLIFRQEKRDIGGEILRYFETNYTINNPGINRYDSSVNKRFHQLNNEQIGQNMNDIKRVKFSPNLTRKITVLEAQPIILRADQRDRRIFYRFENRLRSEGTFRNDSHSRRELKAKTTKEILYDLKDFVNFPSSVMEKKFTDTAVELTLI